MSLIEVTLAIGIIGLAVIPLLGVLATGHGSYHSAAGKVLQASLVHHIRARGAELQSVGDTLPDMFFTQDAIPCRDNDPNRLYRVSSEEAVVSTVSGTDTTALTGLFRIEHIPSGQSTATVVVHVTPRG